MKQAILPLMSAVLLLSSCSAGWQDNKTNNYLPEDITLSPVSQAYDGYEELLGKEYKNFKLPENIHINEIQNVYILDCNKQMNTSDELYNEAGKIFKEFYGDEYDESIVVIDENNGLSYDKSDYVSASYGSIGLYLRSSDYILLNGEYDEHFFAQTQGDSVFLCDGSERKICDETKLIDDYLNGLIMPLYKDYEIETKDIYIDASGGNTMISFNCSKNYEGIPFQYETSDYFNSDSSGNLIYWASSGIKGSLKDNNHFIYVYASVPYTIVNKTRQENIISFADAVKILENELAENSFYNFVNVELMYCYLTEQPQMGLGLSEEENEKTEEEYHKQIKIFEPMWCFEIEPAEKTDSKMYIKVNAVTGEIFMDFQSWRSFTVQEQVNN